MLRLASLVALACATGCLGPSGEVTVTGAVDLASGCAQGASRFGVVLASGNGSDQITLLCTDDGAFDLSTLGDGSVSVTVTAACSSGKVIGQTVVPVDTGMLSADVGVVHVSVDGSCP
jgi:hypothetical protein